MTVLMGELACDCEQAVLIRLARDPAAEEPRLAGAADIGRRKAPGRYPEHRQIRFVIADRHSLGISSKNPVAQRQETSALVDFLGENRGVDRRVLEDQS